MSIFFLIVSNCLRRGSDVTFLTLVLITTDVTLFTKRDCDAGVMQEERAHRCRCARNYFQLLINIQPKAH